MLQINYMYTEALRYNLIIAVVRDLLGILSILQLYPQIKRPSNPRLTSGTCQVVKRALYQQNEATF